MYRNKRPEPRNHYNLQSRSPPTLNQPHQSINNALRLTLNPPQQHLASRNIRHQPNSDTRAPNPRIYIALLVDFLPPRTGDEMSEVFTEVGAAGTALEAYYFLRNGVFVDARCIAEGSEYVDRVCKRGEGAEGGG